MKVLPRSFEALITALGTLPGVGPRSAERYAYALFKGDQNRAAQLADAIADIHKSVAYCKTTFALVEAGQTVSSLYSDPERDKTTIAVVAEPFDIISIENTGSFRGTYHVLGGLISPIDGINPEQLHINELVERVSKDKVKELILALNASVEGESTALYIQRLVDVDKVVVTRLARGIPVGLDLEYADQITLGRALEGRTAL